MEYLCDYTPPPTTPICSICLNDIIDKSCTLGCDHVFHSTCIITCAIGKSSVNCPNCRSEIVSSPEKEMYNQSPSIEQRRCLQAQRWIGKAAFDYKSITLGILLCTYVPKSGTYKLKICSQTAYHLHPRRCKECFEKQGWEISHRSQVCP